MTSVELTQDTDARLRDALRREVADHGIANTTMTSLAARAGVARMTAYRRAGSVERVLLEALTEDISAATQVIEGVLTPARIGDLALETVSLLRDNALFRAIQKENPALLMPYAIERLGAVQTLVLHRLTTLIERGQTQGVVRDGDAHCLALTLVLSLQGFALARALDPDTSRHAHDLVIRYLQVVNP